MARRFPIAPWSDEEYEAQKRFIPVLSYVQRTTDMNAADRKWWTDKLNAIWQDDSLAVREYFGFKVRRGRKPDLWRYYRLQAFVELAKLFGHSKESALFNAMDAFGYKSLRTVERMIASMPALDMSRFKTKSEKIAHLSSFLEVHKVTIPQPPTRKVTGARKLGR